MEVNRASGGNVTTASPEKQESAAGIQTAGDQISDSPGVQTAGGRISYSAARKSSQQEIDASGEDVTPAPNKQPEESAGVEVDGGRTSDSIDGKTSRQLEFQMAAMAVDTSGVNIGPSASSANPNESTGIVVAGSGTTCHQCRQSKRTSAVACKNRRRNKQCSIKICDRCLWNRYGERAEEVVALAEWKCPKCRGICNCSICQTKRGEQPTGRIHKKGETTDEKEPNYGNNEDLVEDSKNDKEEEEAAVADNSYADIPLPMGTELTSVLGLDVRPEDVGNALQFLEFCFVFEEILELKYEEAENVLRELLRGGDSNPEKNSLIAQFHIHLLSLLKESTPPSPSDRESSWFQRLKNFFSEAQSLLTESEVNSLLMATDYDSLNASEKLRVLNLLCDEVLGTEKVRNWIENENNKFQERIREAKQKVHAKKSKEKSLKLKMKEDITKAISAKDGAPLSISEHEAVVSQTKSEVEQAHSEVLESESILRNSSKTCDALRIEPLCVEHRGNIYWKLNSTDKSYVLQQNVGTGDSLSLDEKWYALDDEGGKVIEKCIDSREKKSRKRRCSKSI